MVYKIVQAFGDPAELEKNVNDLIKKGWQLYGDPLIGTANPAMGVERGERPVPVYCQAMTRD
jgi:hypothetical protein